jgi:hypothetical protein
MALGDVPTLFPAGVSNAAIASQLATFGAPDPTKYIVFWYDFFGYDAAATGTAHQWLATATGAATAVVGDINGGVLVVTNGAADDDNYFAQWQGNNVSNVAETFKIIAGKQTWFKTRFKISDATQSDFVIGLQVTDTTPLAVVDGLYFLKVDGSATLNMLLTKNSTSTTVAVTTLVSDTFVDVGFYYDGATKVAAFVNGSQVAQTTILTNLIDDEELAISFGIQNGEAVAKVLSLDYIFCASDR